LNFISGHALGIEFSAWANQFMKTPAELFSLKGRAAVVIGGTGVLCGEMAEGLAAAGATVALVGRDAAKAQARLDKITKAGGKAEFFACDTTSKAGLQKLLAEVLKKFGRVDILVNGAGVNSATPFLDIPEEEFDKIITVNLKGLLLACQVFGKHMVDHKSGSIINLGSASGLTPLSRVFTYSASKAAVHNLSKNLAREWAISGVRVNILVPGFFPAEQNRKVLNPERIAQIMGKTPMKRFGDAHELVGATLLLASDAGSFITGAEIVVDGGFAAMSI
jgi:NAD(P)-dependent dehydrogenase (short-subunit alcohol dehydrogenase family)